MGRKNVFSGAFRIIRPNIHLCFDVCVVVVDVVGPVVLPFTVSAID